MLFIGYEIAHSVLECIYSSYFTENYEGPLSLCFIDNYQGSLSLCFRSSSCLLGFELKYVCSNYEKAVADINELGVTNGLETE